MRLEEIWPLLFKLRKGGDAFNFLPHSFAGILMN